LTEMTMKGFIDKYFSTNPPNKWSLESFILEHDGPEYVKKDCLYFYKEDLQNICKSSEFDNAGKLMTKRLIETYKKDKK
ncbi:4098_t:CDS:1, partial [Funneliformis geosporum]